MTLLARPRLWWWVGAVLLGTAIFIWRLRQEAGGDARLAHFVRQLPSVPIVFTSRTEPASLIAQAPAGEGLVFPGQRLWTAREGRLRLLTPGGQVHELTWEKKLPDGDALIDVMGPNVSPSGEKVAFAGRRAGDEGGHFRLYEVDLATRDLRQLTGLPGDVGCWAPPPMRYLTEAEGLWSRQMLAWCAVPGTIGALPLGMCLALPPRILPETQRRQTDYDDVDPVYLHDESLVFVSSRGPDLGRDHARRATTLWRRDLAGKIQPLTANRNNDRWPFFLVSGNLVYSSWSRNREVVTADGRDVQPFVTGTASLTSPTDLWAAWTIKANGSQFGMMLKLDMPVWRPRPLFNGNIVFMTAENAEGTTDESAARMTIVQSPPNAISIAPSATRAGSTLPMQKKSFLRRAPNSEHWRLATPSPSPDRKVLVAAAPRAGTTEWNAHRYGIYWMDDAWEAGDAGSTKTTDPQLLFDDPDLVDAEPVAVYARPVAKEPPSGDVLPPPSVTIPQPVHAHPWLKGTGQIQNGSVYMPAPAGLVGQETDSGAQPIFQTPPEWSIDHLRFYISHPDRFDHPLWPRVAGPWEELARIPMDQGKDSVRAWLPAGAPTVLAGFTRNGDIVRWRTPAQDSQGRQAEFYAIAGDHYSATRPGGYGFCNGCHPGHSVAIENDPGEKRR